MAGSGGSGASGGSGNIQMEVFTRNCDNDESFMQELQAATGFDSRIFGARFFLAQNSGEIEEDATPTASDAVWTARTAHIRIVVEMQILDRFPVVFSPDRSEQISLGIEIFVVLVWMLQNFAERRCRPRRKTSDRLFSEPLGDCCSSLHLPPNCGSLAYRH